MPSITSTVCGLGNWPRGQSASVRDRPRPAVLAIAGLGALVVVLVATPDVAALVFFAWVLVLAGVAAVAYGIALGFRHQSNIEQASARPRYLTAESREAEELGDAMISAREVAAVDGDALARDEGRVA